MRSLVVLATVLLVSLSVSGCGGVLVTEHADQVQSQNPGGRDERWRGTNDARGAANDQYARAANLQQGDTTFDLRATQFGVTAPAGATGVSSVTFGVRRSTDEAGVHDFEVQLVQGNQRVAATEQCQAGRLDCSTVLWPAPRDSATWMEYGGDPLATWGVALSVADVTAADFGVSISATRDNGNADDVFIDAVNLTVDFVVPPPPGVTVVDDGDSDSDGGAGGNDNGQGGIIALIVILVLLCLLCCAALAFFLVKNPDKLEAIKGGASSAASSAGGAAKKAGSAAKASAKASRADSSKDNGPNGGGGSVWDDEDGGGGGGGGGGGSHLADDDSAAGGAAVAAAVPLVAAGGGGGAAAGPVNYHETAPNPFGANQVFEVPLHHVRKGDTGAPCVVEDAIVYLEEHALQEEGLLRLAGSSSEVKDLRAKYDAGNTPDFSACGDVHSVGALLKQYLRALPVRPILVTDGLKEAGAAFAAGESDTAIRTATDELADIPEDHWFLIHLLFNFLANVDEQSAANKMSADNLVVVFAPTLQLPHHLLKLLIVHARDIFTA